MARNTDTCLTDFIKTELHIGLTFSTLALQSKNGDKTSRNTAHAQKAHDAAVRYFRKTVLSEESATEVRNLFARLEANLALLR